MAKATKTETGNQEKTLQDAISTLLSGDLTSLPVAALEKLRNAASSALQDGACGRLGENDIVVEYDVRIRAGNGKAFSNSGLARMNRITAPRLLGDAPRRFETEFMQQVYEPVYADAMELFDTAAEGERSLSGMRQAIGEYEKEPLPGLPPVYAKA